MSKIEYYHTISGSGEGLYKEKGSKFVAFAYHVASESDVKEALENLRKEYYDARHHCYAYMLGAVRKNYRANDDGEPNHSAGDPILGQINSKELTNVLVVVIRYFGGTKLGVSGLINAYKVAAEEALNNVKVVKVEITIPVVLTYNYDVTNEVMRLVSEFDIKINDQRFEANCQLEGELKIGLKAGFVEKVQLLNDTGSAIDMQIDED